MLKLNKDSAVGTFVIIIAFCLVYSVLVSSAVVALGPFQQAAIANDRQVNILKVSGYNVETTVADTYAKHIEARMLDVASGNIVPEMQAQADGYNFASASKQAGASEAIPADKDIAKIRSRAKLMPIYIAKDDNGTPTRIILPFYGQALWSTAYGYLALSTDANTVEGIVFYSHGETPGLGGEIDNPRWQAIWQGKKLENADGEYALNITKVPDREGPRKDFDVDALSGATLTSNGVNNAVQYWFGDAYKPFLDNLRKGEILK